MKPVRMLGVAIAAGAMALAGCGSENGANAASVTAQDQLYDVTVHSDGGAHAFRVQLARTRAEQDRGLMFRTELPANGGMIFHPYPAEGGPPREAGMWMKNVPIPLDIVFIREDGTIARIANAVPFDETTVASGEPVTAVLELRGGRAAELGIEAGDRVTWTGL